MQLHTPRRYSAHRPKRNLISLRWLWLYVLAPIVIYGAILAYNNRVPLGSQLAYSIANFKPPNFNPPTPTATIPAQSLADRIASRLQSGDMNDAITAMGQFTDSNPNDSKWHILRPMFLALRADGDPTLLRQAVEAGMAAINAVPESSTAWAAEALALDWANTSNDPVLEKQALIDVLHALDLNSTDPDALAILAGIDVTLKKFPDALSNADKALKQNPQSSYAYFVKGQVAATSGDTKTATNYYKQAWDISLSDPLQWGGIYAYYLTRMFNAQGQNSQAQAILTDALKYDKNYARLGRQSSDLYANLGDWNKAIEAARQCTDVAPAYAPCWAVLPKLNSLNKAFDLAARAADNAQKFGSIETSPYYWGGEAYYQLNDCLHAIPLLKQGYQLALKRGDSSVTQNFIDALNQCGITPAQIATPTPSAIAPPPTPITPATITPPPVKPTIKAK